MLVDVAPGAGGELAHVVLVLADDRGDLRVRVVEHVVQQQHGSLLGREPLQQCQQRHRQRVGRLGVPGRIVLAVGDDRLRQPLAEVALAPGARRPQLVDRQPRRDGGRIGTGRGDLLAFLERLVHAQQRLLHDVFGFGDAAQHAVGDREGHRPQLVEKLLAVGHRTASRGLGLGHLRTDITPLPGPTPRRSARPSRPSSAWWWR